MKNFDNILNSAIFQSSIVWSALIGFAFLKEKLHWLDLVSIPFTLSGIVLIAKASFQIDDLSYDSYSFQIPFTEKTILPVSN